jgi:hypothetical protein
VALMRGGELMVLCRYLQSATSRYAVCLPSYSFFGLH